MVSGPLYVNSAVTRDPLLFPPMKVGDRIAVKPVGAYNVTQWMQFITYRPAVVLVSRDGEHAQIRRREDLDSIVSHEETPPWL